MDGYGRTERHVGQESVPSWEKEFCAEIGLIPWEKLLEAKRFMHLHENVASWNDTAAEEAFINAKILFWARINGVPCDIELPDPDVYIDKVDWHDKSDRGRLLDLESAGSTTVVSEMPSSVFCDNGWGCAEPQGCRNPEELDDWGAWNREDSRYVMDNRASARRDTWQDSRNQRDLNAWNANNSYGVQGEWNQNDGWGWDRAADSNSWGRDRYYFQRNVTIYGRGRAPAPWRGNRRTKEGRDGRVRASAQNHNTTTANQDGY